MGWTSMFLTYGLFGTLSTILFLWTINWFLEGITHFLVLFYGSRSRAELQHFFLMIFFSFYMFRLYILVKYWEVVYPLQKSISNKVSVVSATTHKH